MESCALPPVFGFGDLDGHLAVALDDYRCSQNGVQWYPLSEYVHHDWVDYRLTFWDLDAQEWGIKFPSSPAKPNVGSILGPWFDPLLYPKIPEVHFKETVP